MLNGSAYENGISCQPESIMGLEGYVSDYFVNPPPEEIEEAAALPSPPLLRLIPAHMETGDDGLLVFVPISFGTLEPPAPPARREGEPDDDDDIVVAAIDVEGAITDSDDE